MTTDNRTNGPTEARLTERNEAMTEKVIHDMSDRDLANHLVGKSIVSTSDASLLLSDGTVLELEDASDCCAWFTGSLEVIDLDDNAITRVERHDLDSPEGDYDEHWSLHILSAHKLIAKVNIDGNATSGYYCHSINLRVKGPKNG